MFANHGNILFCYYLCHLAKQNMQQKIIDIISQTLGITSRQVGNTIVLLEEGASVPFISRYRKERTGSLDEVQVLRIKELNEKYIELEKRKEGILKTIEEQKEPKCTEPAF